MHRDRASANETFYVDNFMLKMWMWIWVNVVHTSIWVLHDSFTKLWTLAQFGTVPANVIWLNNFVDRHYNRQNVVAWTYSWSCKWCSSWSLGMAKQFRNKLYFLSHYLSMLGLKLSHVSRRGPWWFEYNQLFACHLFYGNECVSTIFIKTNFISCALLFWVCTIKSLVIK